MATKTTDILREELKRSSKTLQLLTDCMHSSDCQTVCTPTQQADCLLERSHLSSSIMSLIKVLP